MSWQDRPPAAPLIDDDGVNWLLPWLARFFGDRYYLLTQIIGRADMLWHGDPGESVPRGLADMASANVSLVSAV